MMGSPMTVGVDLSSWLMTAYPGEGAVLAAGHANPVSQQADHLQGHHFKLAVFIVLKNTPDPPGCFSSVS